jgi:hypothetical protein
MPFGEWVPPGAMGLLLVVVPALVTLVDCVIFTVAKKQVGWVHTRWVVAAMQNT